MTNGYIDDSVNARLQPDGRVRLSARIQRGWPIDAMLIAPVQISRYEVLACLTERPAWTSWEEKLRNRHETIYIERGMDPSLAYLASQTDPMTLPEFTTHEISHDGGVDLREHAQRITAPVVWVHPPHYIYDAEAVELWSRNDYLAYMQEVYRDRDEHGERFRRMPIP